MGLLRKILFPLAVLYGWVTQIRTILFDRGLIRSRSFGVPVIAVGNLSVGGTGKTPMIEYLIRLLSGQYQIAVLSRGYKRKSSGFVLADATATAERIGDEPFQFYAKFPNIQVAVSADRCDGIDRLLQASAKPQVILLDDAFQHRKVKAGFYVLLTAYGDLYADDWMLPTGNLREPRAGANRADVVVVTKCPALLSVQQQTEIRGQLKLNRHQQLFFATIAYDDAIHSESESLPVAQIKPAEKLLLAGIAKPKPFFEYLQNGSDPELTYPDHHDFSAADIDHIIEKAHNRMIVTTEKDYVRLKGKLPGRQLFYLPIKTEFLGQADTFNQTLLNYVGTSTANR